MEFKYEQLVEHEIEIAGYLIQDISLKRISEQTGLSKKLIAAHIHNMMKKLQADNLERLIAILKSEYHGYNSS